MADLEIRNLEVQVEGNKILKGVSLDVNRSEIVAIMGPNGSGKSTLAYTLMGHPKYRVVGGTITFLGEDITNMKPHLRARKGLFLSFQYPQEVSGVSVANFLRTALNTITGQKLSVLEFQKMLKEKMELLKMDHSFAGRYLNEGFSGGRRSGQRSCNCPCSSQRSRSSTKRIPDWTSTASRSSRTA